MATARWARGIARTSTDRRAAGSNPTIRTTMANNTVIPRTQHARRRKQQMRMAGNDAILILPAAPERVRSRDTHYPYRQDSDLLYLAGFPEPEAVLVRSEEHTSELQSLMRLSYAVFCLKKQKH